MSLKTDPVHYVGKGKSPENCIICYDELFRNKKANQHNYVQTNNPTDLFFIKSAVSRQYNYIFSGGYKNV